ncbi:hypothetical protein ATJ88_0720 [Isoptericola jiangsuensis]|uniref:N-acetyltransferase domain-containing protein n=1 Tax=Isoptericola jiangsuensis TaxID=548579 RepID=A0A2A9EUV6_9MICO|nr:GNAT family N-acetyltransferase [Isoptericola jiangsuensis]PFG42070.1 hypothetical protein ATJ88_0720 [Isoptericola jiangsuensis]
MSPASTSDRAALLAAYDDQLRTDAETAGAGAVGRHGPLHLATFPGGHGHVTYRDLAGVDAAGVRELVGAAVEHFRGDPAVRVVEWKTRGHDVAPGLHEALVAGGFVAQEPESVMVGEATALAVDVDLPAGVRLRRVTSEADVRAMTAMVDEVFGDDPVTSGHTEQMLQRQEAFPGMELWVAESGGQVVSAGRLEPVAGTDFAGLWGGATRPGWRGQGIYRALTAARARSALDRGRRYLHSDSTELSRPILERSGLVKVSTTTPYLWTR